MCAEAWCGTPVSTGDTPGLKNPYLSRGEPKGPKSQALWYTLSPSYLGAEEGGSLKRRSLRTVCATQQGSISKKDSSLGAILKMMTGLEPNSF
jgi:hypothetical protein